MKPDTIATPEEKIYKLKLPEALQDGAPLKKTARVVPYLSQRGQMPGHSVQDAPSCTTLGL
jgi:hypothetical protein